MSALENFRLKVFRAVAEKLNFRAAAEALFLTQPAVTSQIKALEEELSVELFDRTANRVALTAAGEALLHHARALHEIAVVAQREVAAAGGARGELRLGASKTIAEYVLPELLADFLRDRTGLVYYVCGANTAEILDQVTNGSVSLGLIEAPSARRGLKSEPFLRDELVVIAAAGHPWQGERISAARLATAPLIVREDGSGTRRVIESLLREADVKLKDLSIVMELASTEAIKSAVERGLGIAFVPRRAIAKELKLGSLVEITVENLAVYREFSAVWHGGPEPQGPGGEFLAFLRLRTR